MGFWVYLGDEKRLGVAPNLLVFNGHIKAAQPTTNIERYETNIYNCSNNYLLYFIL